MEKYDLLIVADATASMSSYLTALNTSLPQIISISALTGCFSRLGVIAYRDYTDFDEMLKFSGWLDLSPARRPAKQPDVVAFTKSLKARGGGDYPEAAKTALAKAYTIMRPDAKTIILLYTDAPPHGTIPKPERLMNGDAEMKVLSNPRSYDGFGPSFLDWVSAAKTLASGERRAQVFALLQWDMLPHCVTYYNFLCAMTGGACIRLDDSTPETISKLSVELLLAWMGVEKPGVDNADLEVPGYWSSYVSTEGMSDLKDEGDPETERFFPVPYTRHTPVLENIAEVALSASVLKNLPKKPTPAESPRKQWDTDPRYRDFASKYLMQIISEDIGAIAINPVFGALWRAVCKDRTYAGRNDLADAFSKAVGEIQDREKKSVMERWLDESYDFSAEIQAITDNVSEADRFPCVFLDPTMRFAGDSADHESLESLSRGDLLEISRSCDPRILRRLGRVLTRLTYVEDSMDTPAHITQSNIHQVRLIPLALATEKYDHQFWKILLHTIVSGAQLTARAAAVLAALTIRMGVTFLADAAESEMLRYKDSWNNVEVPETWAINCLRLLLEADRTYRKTHSGPEKPSGLLKKSDVALFERLVAFKTLEHNLDAPLTARIPCTPEKAVYPIGPLVTCQLCHYPRSVTIMGPDARCGACLGLDPLNPNIARVAIGASRDATPMSDATWVECNIPSCRAQYVVYKVEALRVRPKCHYCRQLRVPRAKGKRLVAPLVDCSKCTNRMIWPEEYRPATFVASLFVCPACESGRETTAELKISAKALAVENGTSWLVEDSEKPDESPFTNRSVYRTVLTMGTNEFMSRITLFPPREAPLTQRGKPILNTYELISTIKELVADWKSKKVDCSLCFSSFWPSALVPACGRRGCLQRICTACSASWYGSNASGSIINTAALACPFCRRLPAPRTLTKYGRGIHAVKDLHRAIENRGMWIYAWCSVCSAAKEFTTRDCARGTPPELRGWTCESCVEELQKVNEKDTGPISKVKPCPKCGTMTEKISGCGHITCPVEGCGTDWCYFCGIEVPNEIYEHMAETHGEIYDEQEIDDYDDGT
ncbi:hypothetical protein BDW68DRAFT_21306 [Aspergillus falconensis]